MKNQNSLFQAAEFVTKPTFKAGTLFVRDGESGDYRMATPKEIIDAGYSAIEKLIAREGNICSVADAKRYFVSKLNCHQHEVFACLFMDNKHAIIAYEELFFGTIDSSAVHPRQVVKQALHHNAAAIICSHNHPSGKPDPSETDKAITVRLRDALAFIDVRLLDHIIVGGNATASLSELGII